MKKLLFYLSLIILFIVIGYILNFLPIWSFLTFLTIPIAIKMLSNLRENFSDPRAILPSNGQMILIHLTFGILLIISLAIPIF